MAKGGDPVDARRPRRLSCDRGKSSTLLPGCWGDDWAIPCTAIRAQPRYRPPSRPAKSYGLPVGKRSRRPRKATRWLPSARSSRGRRGARGRSSSSRSSGTWPRRSGWSMPSSPSSPANGLGSGPSPTGERGRFARTSSSTWPGPPARMLCVGGYAIIPTPSRRDSRTMTRWSLWGSRAI